ncbi:hypothetical protein BDV36DRAFT_267016 [Aspergillus pseudocaelatus]|uniref:Uncharacterized protein n=1 Tax=Aspergillus pseudocaelatus TaxID=1825620 RepID=A0ABQ6W9V7_9EURO|nr:hypothetical protein BDV36DRAFT_267016 [Aspergillus pseudocaelatus]
MFRRLVTVAPRVGTVVSPRITPALSGIQSQPILRAPATKRGYHEKVLDHYNNPRNGTSTPTYQKLSGS